MSARSPPARHPVVPEGDTIFRTARSLREWLLGREITGARSQRAGVPPARLVGHAVVAVDARAKHLLVRLSSGEVVHTHMGMTGSWHVYLAGERWRKPGWQARLVLEAGDRVAVCFEAPVVELLASGEEDRHPALSRLGPDVLVDPLDLAEVLQRAAARPPELTVGELLLDQQVVSGVGNIYRCESLFLCRLHPWTPRSALDDEALGALVAAASRLMRGNLEPRQGFDRQFGGGRRQPWVYGRDGRPCCRCRTAVAHGRLGEQAREVWWCPSCQASREEGLARRPGTPGPSNDRR